MTLSEHANNHGQPLPTNEELEDDMRNDLAPLIDFLSRASAVDEGYPDAYPKDIRAKEGSYREDGLNIDCIGCTLEHSVNFSETGVTHDERDGHGRYLQLTALVQEHHLYGDEPIIFRGTLFESGKFHSGRGIYDDMTQDFDREDHITTAMRDIIGKYVSESSSVNNNIDAALERGQEFIKIANDVRRQHFGLNQDLEMEIRDGQLVTGFLSQVDEADHTAG